jgi:hypothetical protein
VDYGSALFTSIAHLSFDIYSDSVAFPALLVLLLIFPTGQVYPRRAARWVMVYVMLYVIGSILGIMAQHPDASVSSLGGVSLPVNPFFVLALAPYYTLIDGTISNIFSVLGLVAAIVTFILRYRAGHMREQQQIKWFVWITCLVLALLIVDVVVSAFIPNNAGILPQLVVAYLIFFYGLLGAFPALAIGLAILRSRLWDIDVIINRTLVYGTLTVLLTLLYFGLVIGLESLVRLFSGQVSQSPIVIVASTLAIAALFQPLRHRIQAIIDHRFYRRKYDAAKTLEALSALLRNEVDLQQLTEHLIVAVQETMQPAYVSLWLRSPVLRGTTGAPREGNHPVLSGDKERDER